MSAPRRSSVSKETLRHSISAADEATKAREKKAKASPQRADFEREFGKHRVKDETDGSWTLTLHERNDIKRAHQMQDEARRCEIERGEVIQARRDAQSERVIRRDGRILDFPSELIDQAKHKFRPVGRGGRSNVAYFGTGGDRYVKGMDELEFVWNDGWEPAPLWYRGDSDRQRDPDGNVWVRRGQDWEVADGDYSS